MKIRAKHKIILGSALVAVPIVLWMAGRHGWAWGVVGAVAWAVGVHQWGWWRRW